MTADDLKKSILQQAIQGKLVPQSPDDEPASTLLDRIRAEKARLLSEGKIKRDKNESIIYRNADGQFIELIGKTETDITDQLPFEIPNSWEWVRLGSVVDFSKSNSVKPNSIDSEAWLLDLEDIEKDSGKVLHKKVWKDVVSKSDKHRFYKGNVLYSKLRPYLNKVVIAEGDGYCTSEILCFDFGLINSKFAQVYLMSPFFVDYAMSEAYGVKMPRIGSHHGNKAFMPLPPLAEQERIVAKIEGLMPMVEEYGKVQSRLDELNSALGDNLRKSVLQYAIQGKLVSQSPDDEPASALLERIRVEKGRLVAEGKIKRDKNESIIYRNADGQYIERIGKTETDITDQIPFGIPDSWEWVRGKSVFNAMESTKPSGEHFTYIDIDAVDNKSNKIHRPKTLSSEKAPSRATRKLHEGDILFSMVRPYLRNIALVEDKYKNAIASTGFYVVSGTKFYDAKFLLYLLLSPYVVDGLNQFMKGENSPSINNSHIENYLYPLPPIEEQNRIVERIEQILSLCK